MKKFILPLLVITLLASSCADNKQLSIDGKLTTVEPYGWFDLEAKNEKVHYKVNTGNIVLSVIFCETIVVPIILTGDQLWEPVNIKTSNE